MAQCPRSCVLTFSVYLKVRGKKETERERKEKIGSLDGKRKKRRKGNKY
jgi:hypothetical protein